jgi:hypothetical protein
MSYIITGTDSAGALSLKRDSAAAAIKKAIEFMADGCRDVSKWVFKCNRCGNVIGEYELDAASRERARKRLRED